MPSFTYILNGESYTVSLEPQPDGSYRATSADRVYTFRPSPAGDGGFALMLDDGDQVLVHAAVQDNTRYVNVAGESFTLEAVPKTGSRRGGRKQNSGDLTANMPGQVREVAVSAGEQVTRGQTLIVLEAMKMETRVTAPAAGTVKRVLVNVGDIVVRGQPLIEVTITAE